MLSLLTDIQEIIIEDNDKDEKRRNVYLSLNTDQISVKVSRIKRRNMKN